MKPTASSTDVKVTSSEVGGDEIIKNDNFVVPSDFDQAHHQSGQPIFPTLKSAYIYSNYGISAWETVDFSGITDLINIQMGPSMVASVLQTSGTLAGLMTSIAMMGSVPSMYSLLGCIGMVGRDMAVASPIFQASKINRKNFYTPLDSTQSSMRFGKMLLNSNIVGIESNAIKSMLPAIISSFVLFDEAIKGYDPIADITIDGTSYKPISLYSIQMNCFTLSNALCIQQTAIDGSHWTSIAGVICGQILNMANCSRTGPGQGSHGLYFQKYCNKSDYKIHNVILNRLLGINNSFSTFLARLIFSYKYSPWKLYIDISKGQREAALKNNKVIFTRYLFEDLNFSDSTESNFKRYVGFDTIDAVIKNKIKKILHQSYDNDLDTIYDDISNLAKDTKLLYNSIVKFPKRCTIDENVMTTAQASTFQTNAPKYNKKLILNQKVFSDTKYNGVRLLNIYESPDKDQLKVLSTIMGNRVSIGMRFVAQWGHNKNYVTEDYYYKLVGLNELMQNATAIKPTLTTVTPSYYTGSSVNLDLLPYNLDGTPLTVTPAVKTMIDNQRNSMDKLINYAQIVGSFIPSLQARATQQKI